MFDKTCVSGVNDSTFKIIVVEYRVWPFILPVVVNILVICEIRKESPRGLHIKILQ